MAHSEATGGAPVSFMQHRLARERQRFPSAIMTGQRGGPWPVTPANCVHWLKTGWFIPVDPQAEAYLEGALVTLAPSAKIGDFKKRVTGYEVIDDESRMTERGAYQTFTLRNLAITDADGMHPYIRFVEHAGRASVLFDRDRFEE